MRILIVGAGATGGYFGARLLAAGRDVTFLVRARRAEQLARTGLVVLSPHGALRWPAPPTVTAGAVPGTYDLVVLSCKAYDLSSAVEDFAPAVGTHTCILPLLNGMAHLDTLDARFGRSRVLGGRCMISSTLDAEGAIVHLNTMHGMTFGARDAVAAGPIEAVSTALGGAGFDAQSSARIEQDMWEKWIFLATLAAATCLMRAPLGVVVSSPEGQTVVTQLLDECCEIAAGQGYPVQPHWHAQTRAAICTPQSTTKASMLRDIEGHARVEADQIVGDLIARRAPRQSPASRLSLLEIAYCHLKAYEAQRA